MTNALLLPNWTVTNVIEAPKTYTIEATYSAEPEACPKCGGLELYRHGTKKQQFRDAPMRGRETMIEVRRPRYRCRSCGGTFMQPLPDMIEERRMTRDCWEYIATHALFQTNVAVADEVGVDEKVVRQISDEYAIELMANHAANLRAPRILGLDELALGPQRTMRCILVDVESSLVVDLLHNRWEKPLYNYFMNLPGRKEVEIVTMDMWRPYKRVAQKTMPQAVIIVDKWHVMRMANDAMETARRVYQGGAGISKETRKQLKKGRSIFLKRPYTLSPKQLLDLDGWLKNTPELRGAYETKEAFMDIWKVRSAEAAKERLDEWRETIPTHLRHLFRPVVTATRNWEDEILNYFRTGRQWTNATTEARNRVVKMTNRIGAGYAFENIRRRAIYGKRPGRVSSVRKKTDRAAMDLFLGGLRPLLAEAIYAAEAGHDFHTESEPTHGSRSTRESE